MSRHHETPEPSSWQDAPSGTVAQPSSQVSPASPATPARPEVTHLPAPGAPNWGLVLSGFVFMLIAAGVILNQITGFQVQELRQVGPMLLVGVGVACALIGVVGLVTRRGR